MVLIFSLRQDDRRVRRNLQNKIMLYGWFKNPLQSLYNISYYTDSIQGVFSFVQNLSWFFFFFFFLFFFPSVRSFLFTSFADAILVYWPPPFATRGCALMWSEKNPVNMVFMAGSFMQTLYISNFVTRTTVLIKVLPLFH